LIFSLTVHRLEDSLRLRDPILRYQKRKSTVDSGGASALLILEITPHLSCGESGPKFRLYDDDGPRLLIEPFDIGSAAILMDPLSFEQLGGSELSAGQLTQVGDQSVSQRSFLEHHRQSSRRSGLPILAEPPKLRRKPPEKRPSIFVVHRHAPPDVALMATGSNLPMRTTSSLRGGQGPVASSAAGAVIGAAS
jgi:hypothetical protein